MPKFIKLTSGEKENDVNLVACDAITRICYDDNIKLTQVIHLPNNWLYVIETPEKILRLIAECED